MTNDTKELETRNWQLETSVFSHHEFPRQHHLADFWWLPGSTRLCVWRVCVMHNHYRNSLGNAVFQNRKSHALAIREKSGVIKQWQRMPFNSVQYYMADMRRLLYCSYSFSICSDFIHHHHRHPVCETAS